MVEIDIVDCIVVPVDRVEEVRKKLCQTDVLDRGHRIEIDKGGAHIPVLGTMEGFTNEKHHCRRIQRRPSSYRELVQVSQNVFDALPSSYDAIGDIVVIRMPDDILEHSSEVGSALLEFVPGARVVFIDRGTMGEWRIRKLELIAGQGGARTIHRENGVNMVVDLNKAYFSPRLAGEHWRIAEMVEPDEVVLDMFTGTGGFALTIAKHQSPKHILAVDINPGAIELLEESIRLNKLGGIEAVEGDALEIDKDIIADRVIMNLPHDSRRFLKHALDCTKVGGVVHYHEIMDDREVEDTKEQLENVYNLKILCSKEVRTYAPGQTHMVFDAKKT